MTRAGRPLIRKGRELRMQRIRATWPTLLVGVLIGLGMTACAMFFIPSYRQFLAGAGLSATVGMIAYLLTFDGGSSFRRGAFGEQNTELALKPLRRRGWKIEHNVLLDGRDIDSVLIGRAGAIAVESKWRDAELLINGSELVSVGWNGREYRQHGMLADARRAARDLQLVLRAQPGNLVSQVLPVLVLWGPRVQPIEGGAVWLEGVLVVDGHQAKQWRPLLQGDPLSTEEVARAWGNVADRVAAARRGGLTLPEIRDDCIGTLELERTIRSASTGRGARTQSWSSTSPRNAPERSS